MKRRGSNAGQAQIEFALCAVFVLFLLISIADMARGLWINHTLAEAVRDGTRYAMVRGATYLEATSEPATLDDVRKVVLRSAIGLSPQDLELVFEIGRKVTNKCFPATSCGLAGANNWPAAGKDQEIGIQATYPYRSLVIMYFPGSKGVQFGAYRLVSVSRERIVL